MAGLQVRLASDRDRRRSRPPTLSQSRGEQPVDLLDRLLEDGVVIRGALTLAAADIDLVRLDLRRLVAAIEELDR